MDRQWRPAPRTLDLIPGQAHVFRFNLAVDFPSTAVLSQEERDRAARFLIADHRRRFIAAHIQLRQVLAGFARCAPADLIFAAAPHGKPYLSAAPNLRFNLSHSQDAALLAVRAGQEVGVDIEWARANTDYETIARRFFSPAEAAALFSLPPGEQAAAFLACWTRKEAYIKARGLGLAIPLDSFDVSIHSGNPVALVDRGSPDDGAGWTILQLPAPTGAAAALAVEGRLSEVCLWDWPPPAA